MPGGSIVDESKGVSKFRLSRNRQDGGSVRRQLRRCSRFDTRPTMNSLVDVQQAQLCMTRAGTPGIVIGYARRTGRFVLRILRPEISPDRIGTSRTAI
jgi:hypothetical protein